jgi:hypothetical protein
LEEALPYYKGQFALLKIQFQLNLPKTWVSFKYIFP